MSRVLDTIGRQFSHFLEETGRLSTLFIQALAGIFHPPFRFEQSLAQMEEVGVNSLSVTAITAAFTGMVLALQSHIGFKRFNAESLVGTVVALSVTRELGPVLTGLVVAARAGSSIAAELGTMKVTEQIDALTTLAVNPVEYLVSPRLLAGIIMLPLLTALADIIGIVGGYLVSVLILHANSVVYIRRTFDFLVYQDIYSGIFKAVIFGVIITVVGCYKGFYAEGGAHGVGSATTGAVVMSYMLIIISNYIMTALFF
jgi:phospholipid/cholesterol/gamma-HCH transport system permease protein